eukprot:GFUD01025662.1.p1 GENE.GFUD01025662.1~~GFUD01025662.1.p1  ORF type:complete len:380 (-),score=92.13 GFUD01025662.1:97-1167(-)
MYSLNSLLVLVFLLDPCHSNVVPDADACTCYNPFSDTIQPHLGDKELTCQYLGLCFVDCDGPCGDVQDAEGWLKSDQGRCMSKSACDPAPILGFEEGDEESVPDSPKASPIIKKKFAPVTHEPTSDQSVLSSTGPATRYQGHGLGLYTYNTDTHYYEQEGGDYYLQQDHDGLWYTFPNIVGCNREQKTYSCIAYWVATFKTGTEDLAGKEWSFGRDLVWTKDDSIEFIPLTSSSCLQCSSILLTSTGPASKEQPDYLGTFNKVPSSFSAGRPVYKNEAGKFLMIKNEYTTFSVWDDMERRVRAGKDGGDEGARGLRSMSGPTCVTNLGEGHEWQYSDGKGGWIDDESVLVSCQDTS